MPRYIYFVMPYHSGSDVVVIHHDAFAFDVVFAFRSKAPQGNLAAYYCLRICNTFKALFDIVDSWQQRRRIIPLVHRIV